MAELLTNVLSERVVARLASARSFERGVRYLQDGHVGALRTSDARLAATVQGSESYTVQLQAQGGRLRFSCSCPVGVGGAFCKHCVAVALSWLGNTSAPVPTLDDARTHLQGLSAASLVELLIDHAHQDEQLARRLLLMAARPTGETAADLPVLRALIDQAFGSPGFVPYREVWGYVRGIQETIDALDELLQDGRAGDVMKLAEYGLTALERAFESVDDSDGLLREVAERLEELHLNACRHDPPDALALAERLFTRELDGEWDLFDQAVLRYAQVLGDTGLACYRELAHARWATVPQLQPGDERSYGSRFAITRIMQSLAELSGSLADQIAIRERDLASGYSFLQIAELCQMHEDHDAALQWATRGLAAFPDDPDLRLRAFLVDEYRRRGRHADALEQSLATFLARPALESYRELATDAQSLGQWTERREAAITLLRTPAPNPAGAARHPSLRGRGCSELVRVHLWEEDPEAAWQAAVDGGCTPVIWLELADRRRAAHPEDTLNVYRDYVEQLIGHKDKRAYAEAVRVIDEIMRPLFTEAGHPADFHTYVDQVRTAHKPKRNLMKLIDALHTTAPA